jgi:hypothetical protein
VLVESTDDAHPLVGIVLAAVFSRSPSSASAGSTGSSRTSGAGVGATLLLACSA